MSPDVAEHAVDVPGGHLHVREWRVPHADRAPFVLLHDSLGSVAQWKDFPEALATISGRPVIAYDRLGYGKSGAREALLGAHLFREEADTYFPAVMQALGVRRCVPLGHSIGGPMALVLAATHPELCEAVVSMAGQAFVEPMTLQGIRRMHAALDDADEFPRLARYHGEKTRWVLDSWPAVWFAPGFASWSLDAYLPHVTCPVLAIHGDRDEYGSTAFPERIATGVAGHAEMLILDDCGHFPHRSRTQAVLDRVVQFLADIPAQEPALQATGGDRRTTGLSSTPASATLLPGPPARR